MNLMSMVNSFFKRFPVMPLIKLALLAILVTKVFTFKIELGDWGNSALRIISEEYKTITKTIR